jgi:hypothetical protein
MLFEFFGRSLQLHFLIPLQVIWNRCISESNAPNKQTFWGYKEGLYLTKRPFIV